MSLNSVNTNSGALIALQSLNAINRDLNEVQNRINTGLRIAGAKDNPAVWAIAQKGRAESRSLSAVKDSLQRGQSITEVAQSAGQSISDILVQMKEKAVAATEAGLTTASRKALSDEYVALRKQIDTIAATASFDGVNLIASGGTGKVQALANADASASIDVAHYDLSTSGSALGGALADLTGSVGSADLSNLDKAIANVSAALSKMGTGAKALERHMTFIEKLQDTVDTGVGNLVDADIAKEAARLQALQVRQQLALQALLIANSTPSLLLKLFR